jgi:hypothetical protein
MTEPFAALHESACGTKCKCRHVALPPLSEGELTMRGQGKAGGDNPSKARSAVLQ